MYAASLTGRLREQSRLSTRAQCAGWADAPEQLELAIEAARDAVRMLTTAGAQH
jgi:hypothetical protein